MIKMVIRLENLIDHFLMKDKNSCIFVSLGETTSGFFYLCYLQGAMSCHWSLHAVSFLMIFCFLTSVTGGVLCQIIGNQVILYCFSRHCYSTLASQALENLHQLCPLSEYIPLLAFVRSFIVCCCLIHDTYGAPFHVIGHQMLLVAAS